MKLFRHSPKEPLWQDEFAIAAADERYVSRRQFTKFLVLTSLGMFVGNLWILARTALRQRTAYAPKSLGPAGTIPVGGVRLFTYPTANDPCLLIRLGEETFVAYSQKCTHLSCAVFYSQPHGRLECPCHEGYFSVRTGEVLQGPPPRPLPRIRLERRGDELIAVGVETGKEA